MITEAIALTYAAALRQAEIEGTVIFDSKIPERANAVVWYERLQRMNQNTGMTPRLRGLHGEVKNRYGKLLIDDYVNASRGHIVIELSGAELKRHKESQGMKYSRSKVFRFITFKQ